MGATLTPQEILEVPSALAGGLRADLVDRLPQSTPPAPWRSNIEMAFWGYRSTPASTAALPAGLRPALPFGAAGFVHYLDGAVGSYREILAVPRSVRGGLARGHVPFIAVDSLPSIHGGRANWALPKLFADFTGSPVKDDLLSATGDGWAVTATGHRRGPWLPVILAGSCAQPWPDGGTRAFRSIFRGRARLASFELDVSGPESLTSWLPGGRHFGIVFTGAVTVGAPKAA